MEYSFHKALTTLIPKHVNVLEERKIKSDFTYAKKEAKIQSKIIAKQMRAYTEECIMNKLDLF